MKEFKSFFKEVGGNEGSLCHYSTRLDTYGCGCAHDCKYCYAKSLLDFRGLWNPAEPAVASVQKIKRKLLKFKGCGKVIRLGGMTDCFQPAERSYKVTYNTIKALNELGIEYLIVTKSDLVASDEYVEIMDKRLAHIQISVTTTDDELSKTYEKATLPSRRIAAIEKLQRLGFDVQLRLSPFIPQYIDFDILNGVKCDKILVEFLRVNTWVKRWFSIDFSEYSLHHGGYNHLPLEKKLEYLGRIKWKGQMSICEDVPEHHKYWEDNVNNNPKDCCNLNKREDADGE